MQLRRLADRERDSEHAPLPWKATALTPSASYARAAALVLGLTALLGLFAAGCEVTKANTEPANVNACYRRCEAFGPGSIRIQEDVFNHSLTCRCEYVFPMPFADAGAR